MSKWNDFKRSVGYYADKTVSKTRELTDTAANKIKLAAKEADIDAEYKNLGKLTYSKLRKANEKDTDMLTREISESLEKLDSLMLEIDAIKADENEKCAAKQAKKAEKNNEDNASYEDEGSTSKENNADDEQ